MNPPAAPRSLAGEDGLLVVRGPGVNFHVLRDRDGLYLVDGGFVGGPWLLVRALRRRGWDREPIRGIVLTHGHLDHTLNVGALAARTGAWVAAPRLDAAHCAGRHIYHGAARVTGWLEAAGRTLLGFRPFRVDRWLDDGDELAIAGGWIAVHLPGHTEGHMGFFSPDRRRLLSGDLFASYGWLPHFPPAIFNDDGALIPASVARALSLDPAGVLPNHGDRADSARHLARLRRLAGKE